MTGQVHQIWCKDINSTDILLVIWKKSEKGIYVVSCYVVFYNIYSNFHFVACRYDREGFGAVCILWKLQLKNKILKGKKLVIPSSSSFWSGFSVWVSLTGWGWTISSSSSSSVDQKVNHVKHWVTLNKPHLWINIFLWSNSDISVTELHM